MYKQLSKDRSSLSTFNKTLKELINDHPRIQNYFPFNGFKIDKIKSKKWKTNAVSELKVESDLKTYDGVKFELCNIDALKKALKVEKPYAYRPFEIQGKVVDGQLDVVATRSISKGTIIGFHFGKICPKDEYSLIPVADPIESKDVTFYIPRLDYQMFNFLFQCKCILKTFGPLNESDDKIKNKLLLLIVKLAQESGIQCSFLKELKMNTLEASIKMLNEKIDDIRKKPSHDPKYHFDFKVDDKHVVSPVLDNGLFIGSGTEFINGATNEDSVNVNTFSPGVYIQDGRNSYSFMCVLAIKDIDLGESILDNYTLVENYALQRGYEVS